MTAFWAFTVGIACGALPVWCWAMCREFDETEAITKQFDEGWHKGVVLNEFIQRATHRARRRLRQCEAVDAARCRLGHEPHMFYDQRDWTDDNPESFI